MFALINREFNIFC